MRDTIRVTLKCYRGATRNVDLLRHRCPEHCQILGRKFQSKHASQLWRCFSMVSTSKGIDICRAFFGKHNQDFVFLSWSPKTPAKDAKSIDATKIVLTISIH